MSVCVCILVHGDRSYYETAAQTVKSVLENSEFSVFVAHDAPDPKPIPIGDRIAFHVLDEPLASDHRAHRFLRKFLALKQCLARSSDDYILLLDADAMLVRPLTEADIVGALAEHEMGMVEQKSITGSDMRRPQFLAHYSDHALKLLAPHLPPPELNTFRFFNSGLVLAKVAHWRRLVAWAVDVVDSHTGEFQVGQHMIADQDLFQLWTNTVEPGCCVELPWYWNHCEHWDADFPRLGVLIAHFSNFCSGPANDTVQRMHELRGPWPRVVHRLLGPYCARRST